jgi:hypothetical protein
MKIDSFARINICGQCLSSKKNECTWMKSSLADMFQKAVKSTHFLNQKHNILMNFATERIPVVEISFWSHFPGEISYRKLLPNKTKKITEPAARISGGVGDGRKTVDNNDDLAAGDMNASMIIGALLIVPIIVIIIVTVIIRLRKSGRFYSFFFLDLHSYIQANLG